MKVSVNILTWNCISTILESIPILKEDLSNISHEFVIVDNGSNDGSEDLATIKNGENLGVSIGKNQGMDASKGEYIFFLDGDIIPVPNSINLLIKWLDEHPEEHAIGFYPNKFTAQHNTPMQTHHEDYCDRLWEPKIHTQAIMFYGLIRRSSFENIRFPVDGPFAGVGYGWEDSDVYMQMRDVQIEQWVAGLNTQIGKYYHEINSSIRLMGHGKYVQSSKERGAWFHKKWGDKVDIYYPNTRTT